MTQSLIVTGPGFIQVPASGLVVAPSNATTTGKLLGDIAAGVGSISPNGMPAVATMIPVTEAFDSTGIPLTASPTSAAFGISMIAGTQFRLLSNAANSSTVNNAAYFFYQLPGSFVGPTWTFTVQAQVVLGSGSVTTRSCTVNAYVLAANGGGMGANQASGAQTISTSSSDLNYTISGGAAGAAYLLSVAVALTETSGNAVTVRVNAVKAS